MLKIDQTTLSFTVLLLKICAINGQSTKLEKGVCTKYNNILSVYKSGYIKNPAYYPLGHFGRETCLWLISTSKGKRIKLEFRKIVLRDTPGCSEDYIQVYDGDGTGNPTLTSKLCGTRFDVEPVYSSDRHMTVIFQSENSKPFRGGMFSLKFYTVYSGFFNVGTMITIVVVVILIIVNALVFRYYCRRRNQRLQRERRIARQQAATRGTQGRTQTEGESGRVTEERGVVGTNLDEPPSYNVVMENSSQNSPRPRQPLDIPLQPPPLYPGTDEPETPPPPYPGVAQQPPEYPPQRDNLTHN